MKLSQKSSLLISLVFLLLSSFAFAEIRVGSTVYFDGQSFKNLPAEVKDIDGSYAILNFAQHEPLRVVLGNLHETPYSKTVSFNALLYRSFDDLEYPGLFYVGPLQRISIKEMTRSGYAIADVKNLRSKHVRFRGHTNVSFLPNAQIPGSSIMFPASKIQYSKEVSFAIGDRVLHPRLGAGTIVNLFEDGQYRLFPSHRAEVKYDEDTLGEKPNPFPLLRRLKKL